MWNKIKTPKNRFFGATSNQQVIAVRVAFVPKDGAISQSQFQRYFVETFVRNDDYDVIDQELFLYQYFEFHYGGLASTPYTRHSCPA
jgi:hypothetical protein